MCVLPCTHTLQSAHAQRHSCTGEIRLNKNKTPASLKMLHLFPLLITVITAVSSRWEAGEEGGAGRRGWVRGEKEERGGWTLREQRRDHRIRKTEIKDERMIESLAWHRFAALHVYTCCFRHLLSDGSFLGNTHTLQRSYWDDQHGLADGRAPETQQKKNSTFKHSIKLNPLLFQRQHLWSVVCLLLQDWTCNHSSAVTR